MNNPRNIFYRPTRLAVMDNTFDSEYLFNYRENERLQQLNELKTIQLQKEKNEQELKKKEKEKKEKEFMMTMFYIAVPVVILIVINNQ